MTTDWQIEKEAARKILANPEAYGTALHVIAIGTYGYEVIYGDPTRDIDPADPLELISYLEEDYSVSIPVENENKLNAIILATATEAFFEDPAAFSSICIALYTGDLGDLLNGIFENPTVKEIASGIMEIQLNHDAETEFSPLVERFIQEILDSEAIEAETEDLDEIDALIGDRKTELFDELRSIGIPEDTLRQAEITLQQD